MKVLSILFCTALVGTVVLAPSTDVIASPAEKQSTDESRPDAQQKTADSTDDHNDDPASAHQSSTDEESATQERIENIAPAAGQNNTKTPTTLDEMRGIY